MAEFHKTRQLLHFEVKELLELPVGILANYEMSFHRPVEIGDRLSTTGRLVEISDFKRTRLGEGYFTKLETNYYNQRDELVSSAQTNLFSYGGKARPGQADDADAAGAAAALRKRAKPSTLEDQAPAEPPEGQWLNGGWHNGTEEMLESWRTEWLPREPADTRWDDVKVGDALPPLVMPITVTRCVFMASASRDFAPQHRGRGLHDERRHHPQMGGGRGETGRYGYQNRYPARPGLPVQWYAGAALTNQARGRRFSCRVPSKSAPIARVNRASGGSTGICFAAASALLTFSTCMKLPYPSAYVAKNWLLGKSL
jgi:hypothetical protein